MSVAKENARRISKILNTHRAKIDKTEQQLRELEQEEKCISLEFENAVSLYYQERYKVKAGDIVVCDGEQYKFVKFASLSTDPMVNRKLASGRWATKVQQIWAYDWDEKKIIGWGL